MPGAEAAREAVERYVAGVHDGSPDVYVKAFAPDAVIEDPVGTPPHVGTAAHRAFWENTLQMADSVRFDVDRIIAFDGEAVMVFTINAHLHTGGTMRIPAVGHYEVDGSGLITNYRAFWDPATMEVVADDV